MQVDLEHPRASTGKRWGQHNNSATNAGITALVRMHCLGIATRSDLNPPFLSPGLVGNRGPKALHGHITRVSWSRKLTMEIRRRRQSSALQQTARTLPLTVSSFPTTRRWGSASGAGDPRAISASKADGKGTFRVNTHGWLPGLWAGDHGSPPGPKECWAGARHPELCGLQRKQHPRCGVYSGNPRHPAGPGFPRHPPGCLCLRPRLPPAWLGVTLWKWRKSRELDTYEGREGMK